MPRLRPQDAPFTGRWWAAGDTTDVVGGRLDLEGGFWTLTLLGWLGPFDPDDAAPKYPAVIHGQIGVTKVTLLDLVPGGYGAAGATGLKSDRPYESRVNANVVIEGMHGDGTETFTSAGVRLLHLNEWANRDPWTSAADLNEGGVQQTMTYTDPGILQADVPGAKASLYRGIGTDGDLYSSVTMTSNETVWFEFESPLALDEIYHEYVRPLIELIELAASERSVIHHLDLVPPVDDYPNSVSVLSALDRGSGPTRPQYSFRFLFSLDDVAFADVMSRWWELQSEMGVVCDLVSALLRPDDLSSNRFLNAASAIEGYHRHRHGKTKKSPEYKKRLKRIVEAVPDDEREWVREQLAFSHEPSFAERVDEVIQQAGPWFSDAIGDPTAWRNWVKNGRNSVAHRDPGMIDIEKEWRTTIRITETMRWLLVLSLLDDLDIPRAVVNRGLTLLGELDDAKEGLRSVKPEWFT